VETNILKKVLINKNLFFYFKLKTIETKKGGYKTTF